MYIESAFTQISNMYLAVAYNNKKYQKTFIRDSCYPKNLLRTTNQLNSRVMVIFH